MVSGGLAKPYRDAPTTCHLFLVRAVQDRDCRQEQASGWRAPAKSIATSTLLCSAIFCDECDGARGLVGRGYTRRVWELQDGFRLSVGLCAICTPRFAVRLQIASESLRRASACAKVIRGAKALLFLLFRVVMFPCDRAFEDCDWAR
jgi:hypothetical protein